MQANFGPEGGLSLEEVLALCAETSEKCVPEPSKKEILVDALVILKKFRNVARRQEVWNNEEIDKIEQDKVENKTD